MGTGTYVASVVGGRVPLPLLLPTLFLVAGAVALLLAATAYRPGLLFAFAFAAFFVAVLVAWFLATAFSNYLAGIIAMFTSVESHGGEGQIIPPPIDTVHVYGDVFGMLALIYVAGGIQSQQPRLENKE